MNMDPKSSTAARDGTARLVDLKSVTVTLVALVLRTTDPGQLSGLLGGRFAGEAALDNEPVVIDLSYVSDREEPVDFAALAATLRRHGLRPIAVRGGSKAQMRAAAAAGLALVAVGTPPFAMSSPMPLDALPSTPPRPGTGPRVVLTEVISEAQPIGSAAGAG